MKLTYKIAGCLAGCLIALGMTSCKKTNDAQFTPELQGTDHGITIQARTTDTIAITKGKATYKADVADTSVLKANILSDKLVIAAVKAGKTTITVTGADGGKTTITVTVEDGYASIEINDTLRFEQPNTAKVYNYTSDVHVYRDKGIVLGSTKYKFGWASNDGANFTILEFNGEPNTLGVKTDATLYTRTNGGVPVRVSIAKAEVIQIQAGIVWIIYQQTAGSQLGVVVQKQWVSGL